MQCGIRRIFRLTAVSAMVEPSEHLSCQYGHDAVWHGPARRVVVGSASPGPGVLRAVSYTKGESGAPEPRTKPAIETWVLGQSKSVVGVGIVIDVVE